MTKISAVLATVLFVTCTSNKQDEVPVANSQPFQMEEQKIPDRANCECTTKRPSEDQTVSLSGFNAQNAYYHSIRQWNHQTFRRDIEINIDSIKYWSEDSVARVTTLHLSNYDTIPDVFARFKNVDRIELSMVNGTIKGLDLFPRLKSLGVHLSTISFDTTDNWLANVEQMWVLKSRIHDLKSFRVFSNLADILLAVSGLQPFPADLSSLQCLNTFVCGAFLYDNVDLSTINLSNARCLKKFVFNTWRDNARGIPKGINDAPSLQEITVEHPRLTAKQKKLLRTFKAKPTS